MSNRITRVDTNRSHGFILLEGDVFDDQGRVHHFTGNIYVPSLVAMAAKALRSKGGQCTDGPIVVRVQRPKRSPAQ